MVEIPRKRRTSLRDFNTVPLDALLQSLRENGNDGKFGWVIGREGNKLELWEPPPRR